MKTQNYRKSVFLVLGTILVLQFAASLAAAQGTSNSPDRIRRELEITDEWIMKAEAFFRQSGFGDQRGEDLLTVAHNYQDQAWGNFRGRHYMVAMKNTQAAREKARAAIMLAQQIDENESLVLRQLEGTDNLASRLMDQAGVKTHAAFQSVYNAAVNNQRKAWEFYHNRQFRPALRLSRQAFKTLEKLSEELQAETEQTHRFRNQVQQTEGSLERIRNMLMNCDSKEALQHYEQARNHYDAAVNFEASGEVTKAENALKIARQMLLKIPGLCGNDEGLDRMFERLQNDLELSSQRIRNSNNDRAVELMESAAKYLQNAEKYCNEEQAEECAANLRAAQINLQKAKRLAGL
jgi:hypothetical protein